MPEQSSEHQTAERRSFLTRVNLGVASLGALAIGSALAQDSGKDSAKPAAHFEPARHDKDEWLEMPGKHRMVFDTTNTNGLGEAIFFANNFIRVNRSDYGLAQTDLAIVIIVRHQSTGFGYNDAMWAKYGAPIATRSHVEDPKSKQAPKLNMFNSRDYVEQLANQGVTLEAISKLGVTLAVCSSSTRANAGAIAKATGGDVDAIFKELGENLVSNARLVPAGIVTVNRAQERGYSLVRTV